jgi:hypothetical protein
MIMLRPEPGILALRDERGIASSLTSVQREVMKASSIWEKISFVQRQSVAFPTSEVARCP